jgi:hypothetical protein
MERPGKIQHRKVFEFVDIGNNRALALIDGSVGQAFTAYAVVYCGPNSTNPSDGFWTERLHTVPANDEARARELYNFELSVCPGSQTW